MAAKAPLWPKVYTSDYQFGAARMAAKALCASSWYHERSQDRLAAVLVTLRAQGMLGLCALDLWLYRVSDTALPNVLHFITLFLDIPGFKLA